MATSAITPHTRIDNSVIDEYISQIGLAGLGVYVIIKKYLNQQSGQCNPSYATIARKAGVDRSTIIRYVKKLKAFNLLDPQLRFREDGGYASNQYNFSPSAHQPIPQKSSHPRNEEPTCIGSGSEPPPLPVEPNHPGGNSALTRSGEPATTPNAPLPPKQVFSSQNKKERTITEVDLMPTKKQKTCPHPPTSIVILPDNITICNHCYGLLNADFKLIEEHSKPSDAGRVNHEESSPEIVAA